MSELSSARNPEILVNGEQQQQQQQDQQEQRVEQQVEEQAEVSPDDEHSEDGAAAEKEMQVKIQSVLQQVRNQIRSRVGVRAPKSGILELVQRVKDRETELAQVNGGPQGGGVDGKEETRAETPREKSRDEEALELCAIFEEKLEASEKALRGEFVEQISQVRKEMAAYTDRAVKELECSMQSWRSHTTLQQQTRPREQDEVKGVDRKQKAAAAPPLASRRGRVLTRTMTTIIPKTCAPVIVGPRAKSETLTYSRGQSSRFLPRDPAMSSSANKPNPSRKPLPPPCPPLHQRRKPVRAKAKTEI